MGVLMYRKSTRANHSSIALCITLVYITSLIIQPVALSESNPSYVDFAKQLPVLDFGPTAPVIISPGECFTSTLTVNNEFKHIYMWSIQGEELRLLNYTLTFEKVNDSTLRICLPEEAVNGVYDLELVSSNIQYSVPRSIWVVKQLDDRVRIVVMSDLHFGAGPVNITTGDINRYSAAILAASLNPTLILWAGDITDQASESETQLAQTYRYIMLYSYPVLGVPGNHDHFGEYYKRYLGPTRWVRVIGDRILIVGIFTNPYFMKTM
jgi:Predicted phosphohydrolases